MILPSDIELVDAAAATYAKDISPFFTVANSPDRLFKTIRADGLVIFAIEGTYDLAGWVSDFLALGVRDQETKNHPTLGFLHLGFYEAALDLLAPIQAVAQQKIAWAITGHSRGAGLAAMIGALMIDDGFPPQKIGMFAPPRVGADRLVEVVTSVPHCAYKYGDDPVPEVPFTLPDFPYAQVPLTKVGAPLPDALDCHHISNYVVAVHSCVK